MDEALSLDCDGQGVIGAGVGHEGNGGVGWDWQGTVTMAHNMKFCQPLARAKIRGHYRSSITFYVHGCQRLKTPGAVDDPGTGADAGKRAVCTLNR